MNSFSKLDALHLKVRQNKWFNYFTVFNRVALAAGFLPAGGVKIMGERFTDLHNNQPMGHYLEALYHTGYYYTTIGILQVVAAMLLLIPRTALLGVLIYFPIILNICILSLAVRFEGSLLTAPLMVISCIYLLCWDYHKLKAILFSGTVVVTQPKITDNKFPFKFFSGVFAFLVLFVFTITHVFDLMPRNTVTDCKTQCDDAKNPGACNVFCECIHLKGQPFDKALDDYHTALKQ
ncbi:hypothetical protein ACFQZS_14695 [Mucilaginibacter calamicampi]|uniref:DoxX protein n=1 Tax=Mucilaginibacter calamicampi TaxID=1302352 RepID=A0ABW2Z3R0_9SPHI